MSHEGPDRRRRAEHRRLARVHDEARGLRGAAWPATAQQALEAIRASGRALVLLDAMMPGMTGFEVCEAVRADDDVARHADPDADRQGPRDRRRARASALGADAYVTKPFSTRELVQKVREMLAWRSTGAAPALAARRPRRRAGAAGAGWRRARLWRHARAPRERSVLARASLATRGAGPRAGLARRRSASAAWAASRLLRRATSPRRPGSRTRPGVLVGDPPRPSSLPQGSAADRGPDRGDQRPAAASARSSQHDMARLVAEASRERRAPSATSSAR